MSDLMAWCALVLSAGAFVISGVALLRTDSLLSRLEALRRVVRVMRIGRGAGPSGRGADG